MMDARIPFLVSMAASYTGSGILAALYVWPWLKKQERPTALAVLVAPHMLIRLMGLGLLVPGLVAATLPAGFAMPTAFGDLAAAALATVATLALARRARWAAGAAWVFNVWGTLDLLLAIFNVIHFDVRPEMLGAAYYIPTALVPPVLLSHVLIFGLLLRRMSAEAPSRASIRLGATSPAR